MLTADIVLAIALVVAILALQSMMARWSNNDNPLVAMAVAILAIGVMGYTMQWMPGGVSLRQVPDSIIRIVAVIIR